MPDSVDPTPNLVDTKSKGNHGVLHEAMHYATLLLRHVDADCICKQPLSAFVDNVRLYQATPDEHSEVWHAS